MFNLETADVIVLDIETFPKLPERFQVYFLHLESTLNINYTFIMVKRR